MTCSTSAESGNDTINGGSGDNAVKFDDSSKNADISHHGGVTTVTFDDTNQTVSISNVQELIFTNKIEHI